MRNKAAFLITFALLAGMIHTNRVARAGQDGLLHEVSTAHQESITSIRTFSCNVSITYHPTSSERDQAGKYWRAGDIVRCQSESKIGKDDILIQGDRLMSINTHPFGGKRNETSGQIVENKIPIDCDAWAYGLLTFYGRDKFRVSFNELLAQPHKLHTVKRIQEDGRELVYVDISHDRARMEIWFDPQVNYLVRKLRMETNGPEKDRLRSEQRVLSFKDVVSGIYFPERVETLSESYGRPKISMSATFTNVQINQPLPERVFKLRFPPGINVTDNIQGKILKTDSQGKPVLQATNREGKPLHLATAPPIPRPSEEGVKYRVTQEEPRSWTRWLLPSSLTFLACAGILWLIRKMRGRIHSA